MALCESRLSDRARVAWTHAAEGRRTARIGYRATAGVRLNALLRLAVGSRSEPATMTRLIKQAIKGINAELYG